MLDYPPGEFFNAHRSPHSLEAASPRAGSPEIQHGGIRLAKVRPLEKA
jgi:hypothetical protein